LISKASAEFWRLYHALPDWVKSQARDAFRLFCQNPQLPGLRFKRVYPTEPIYSARAGARHRAVGILDDGKIVWFWIGDHDDYMRLLASL
jgi:hypothetical protein